MEVDDEGSVRPHPHHPRSCLMAARHHIQGDLMMQKPRFMHRYTRGPDGTRGFSRKRVLKGPMDVVTSRPIFLADTVSRNVHSRRPNVLFFLAAFTIFASVLQVVATVSVPFSIYALNSNGLMDSVKLHHINIAINARNPHTFVLSESKTNSKTGPNLPNGDYNIFEEPGVQSDNFHTYKWGVAVGIRKTYKLLSASPSTPRPSAAAS
jgi:hypothetical protein